jgi:hypothetical protein
MGATISTRGWAGAPGLHDLLDHRPLATLRRDRADRPVGPAVRHLGQPHHLAGRGDLPLRRVAAQPQRRVHQQGHAGAGE